jgi:hypothetical protein
MRSEVRGALEWNGEQRVEAASVANDELLPELRVPAVAFQANDVEITTGRAASLASGNSTSRPRKFQVAPRKIRSGSAR